jgi:hypothetical protein
MCGTEVEPRPYRAQGDVRLDRETVGGAQWRGKVMTEVNEVRRGEQILARDAGDLRLARCTPAGI